MPGYGCDDDAATLQRLVDELTVHREARGAKPMPALSALQAKWEATRSGAKRKGPA